LSTLWLALLPIDLAARLWFGLNLIMLFASVSLLTTGARVAARLLSFLLGMIWLPALGSLFVGQYGFPVLLGAALMIFALRRENALLTACAAALLTFKPHIGAPLLLMVLAYLWLRRDRFGRCAAAAVLAAGAILFVAGFAASPLWPLDYYRSLTGFRDVSQCHQCVSLSMAIAGAAGGALDQAVWIALLIAVVLIAWLVASWRLVAGSAGRLVTTGLLVTLLMSPYLQNYDYLVLLIPFMEFGRDAKGRDWLWLALAYVLPPISVAFFGVAGSLSLVLSALILFALAARRSDAKAAKPSVSRPA
jgi:hypothetical protein